MSAPAYQELATVADFLRFGLPGEALRAARTTQAPVTATGAGVGLVAPGGALDVGALYVASLDVLVEVVAGGAPGTATWRWSHDGGTTWTTAAVTPAAGSAAALAHPASGVATGLSVRFVGTQTAGARYAWTARSCVADALRAANDEAAGELGDRFGLPLATVPSDLVRDVCVIAAADVAAVVGYNPTEGADRLLESRAKAARERLKDRRTHVTGARAEGTRTTPQGPRAYSSNTRR